MKIFWIILTLLALTGGVYVATSTARHTRQAKVTEADRRATATALAEVTAKDKVPPAPPSTSPTDQPANRPTPETPSSASPLDTIPSASVAPSRATSTKPDPAPAVVAPPPASVPAAAPATESPKTTTPPPVDESANPKSSTPTEPSTTAPEKPPATSAPLDTATPTKTADAAAPATSAPTSTPATSSTSASAPAGGPGDSKSPPPPDDGLPKLGKFSITPAILEPQPDGSTLVDKRFRLKGAGTKEKPYEISWDLLTSAEESFEPRSGKKRIPERLAMLNNKYVTIKGYIAFPMMVSEPRELLMMLNQWDGCCIGVPPTPYDAIEVQLDNPVNAEERMTTTGGITGRFVVKPYIVGDWLVGLYVLERGEMLHRTMSTDGT